MSLNLIYALNKLTFDKFTANVSIHWSSVTGVTLILYDASSQTISRYTWKLHHEFAVLLLVFYFWSYSDLILHVHPFVGAWGVWYGADHHSTALLWNNGDHPDQKGGLSNQIAIPQIPIQVSLVFGLLQKWNCELIYQACYKTDPPGPPGELLCRHFYNPKVHSVIITVCRRWFKAKVPRLYTV